MSGFSLAAFLLLVALVCAALLAGVRVAAPRRLGAVALGTAVWLAATGALAHSGLLSQFDRVPPVAPFFLLGLAVCTVLFSRSSTGARLGADVPLAALVGFQAFRVPLEVLLHRLSVEGVLPVEVTYAGWNGDVLTGLLALPLSAMLWRGREARTLVAAWNALGLALLAVVVATAALSLPTPFQLVAADPSTAAVVAFPLVWLPAVLVQAAFLGHLLVFRRLRETTDVRASAPDPEARVLA